jgi:hypothetical protein
MKTIYTLEIKLESEHIAFDSELIKTQVKTAIETNVRPKVTEVKVKSIK